MSKRTSGEKDLIETYFDYDLNFRTKTLWMGSVDDDGDGGESGVDYNMAEKVIKGLDLLDRHNSKDSKMPITIKMNNIGGDEIHGMAIYDAIRECESHVHIVVYGHAMSMGSIILQAADKRIMQPHAELMIHYGRNGSSDHAKNNERHTKRNKKYDRWMEDLFLAILKPIPLGLMRELQGQPIPKGNAKHKIVEWARKDLQDMINFDCYLSAAQALQLGLIDEIVGSTDRLTDKE